MTLTAGPGRAEPGEWWGRVAMLARAELSGSSLSRRETDEDKQPH